ncbi:MAG: hypothetical protein AB1445_09840 [Bacillota bacterium]
MTPPSLAGRRHEEVGPGTYWLSFEAEDPDGDLCYVMMNAWYTESGHRRAVLAESALAEPYRVTGRYLAEGIPPGAVLEYAVEVIDARGNRAVFSGTTEAGRAGEPPAQPPARGSWWLAVAGLVAACTLAVRLRALLLARGRWWYGAFLQ